MTQPPDLLLTLHRSAQVFAHRADLAERLAPLCSPVELAPDELLHPAEAAEYVVRRGKMRVSQLLPDGREITRAVLQAGGVLTVLEDDPTAAGHGEKPADDVYSLPDLILMALGETELWQLPPGSLASV